MDFEKRMRVKSPCMFCSHHTHDFPSDDWHEKKHMQGWGTVIEQFNETYYH